MALHVGLGQHIDAVLVAEVVEVGVVGIVRGAHGVDVQTLHSYHIVQHLLLRDGAASEPAVVVAVDAMQDDALAVDEQGTIITDAHRTESHLQHAAVDYLIAMHECDAEVIEFRSLSRPRLNACDVVEGYRLVIGNTRCQDALTVANLSSDRSPTHHFHIKQCAVECGSTEEVVFDSILRSRPQQHVALDARQPPVVLTLEERAAGKAVASHGECVFTFLINIRRDVPLRRQERVFGITHEPVVHPDVIAMTSAVEADEHVATLPLTRHGERAAVGAYGILHLARVCPVGRTVGHDTPSRTIELERIGEVGIERLVPLLAVTPTIDLPRAGHNNVSPLLRLGIGV